MITQELDKAQWLELIRDVRAEWEKALEDVGFDRMLEPGVEGDWSVKDVIAHVTFWEEIAAKYVEAGVTGQPPIRSPYAGLETDEYNAAIYNANKDKSLDEVLAWSKDVHSRVLAAIDKLSEEDLTDVTRFPWLDKSPLWEYVEGDGYEHIQEHTAHIREWLKRRDSA